MHLLVSEVFKKVAEAPDAEKAKVLRSLANPVIQKILQINFDPKIEFALPEGEVPYKHNDAPQGMSETNLWIEFRKMYLFIKGGHPTLAQPRRESLFIQLLEGLNDSDARLLVALKDKKLPIERSVVDAALPGLLPPAPVIVKTMPLRIEEPKVTPIAAKEFDEKFDKGEDVTEHLDVEAKVVPELKELLTKPSVFEDAAKAEKAKKRKEKRAAKKAKKTE